MRRIEICCRGLKLIEILIENHVFTSVISESEKLSTRYFRPSSVVCSFRVVTWSLKFNWNMLRGEVETWKFYRSNPPPLLFNGIALIIYERISNVLYWFNLEIFQCVCGVDFITLYCLGSARIYIFIVKAAHFSPRKQLALVPLWWDQHVVVVMASGYSSRLHV